MADNEKLSNLVKELISNFGIYRSGCYDVPEYVINDCIEETISRGEVFLSPLFCYEKPLRATWLDLNNYIFLKEGDLEFLESYIHGGEYYLPDDDEVALISEILRKSEKQKEDEESYKTRRRKSLIHTSNKEVRSRIFERDGWKCLHCGSSDALTVDHIKPVKRGGGDDDSNLQTLCKPCNSKKGDK